MRSLLVALLLLVVVAPTAFADGYRERRVREAAVAAGFGDIAGRVAGASRPTILVGRRVLDRAPRTLGTSRFGGRPDPPRGDSWPPDARLPRRPERRNGRCWFRTRRGSGAWRHRFSMGWDERPDGVGFEVADGGRLQIAICAAAGSTASAASSTAPQRLE